LWSLRCLTQRRRIGSTRRGDGLDCAGIWNAEPCDHLAQFLPRGDVGDADFA